MKFYLYASFLLFTIFVNAQIGIGTTSPNGALDITSSNDGLLVPRVALTATTTVLPIITGTESEVVYNTATVADVTPGFYYLSTATGPWVRLGAAASASDWLLTGNTGVIDGTHFIGTAASTNVDVAFRRNNAAAGKIGTLSTSFGVGALTNGASTNSTAFGTNALTANTANNNVAFGNGALAANTSGITNTAVGTSALAANTSAGDNTAVGYNALKINVGGSQNTAVGSNALAANNGGIGNTAIGYNALLANFTTASWNTAVGANALKGINSNAAQFNTAVGYGALSAGTGNFSNNTALGYNALVNNTNTGINNIGIGYNAGSGVTTGYSNIAIGASTGGAIGAGYGNVIVGNSAGNAINGSSYNNVVLGNGAGTSINSGNTNVIMGSGAGSGITTGSSNILIGTNAGNTSVTGAATNNVAIGNGAQVPTVAGSNQIRIGDTNMAYAGIQVAWTTTSDKRWKNTIKDSRLGLDFLKTLRPVSYFRNNDANNKTEYGFIAQEVETAFVKAGDPNNAIISKDDNGMYGVRYNDFIAITVKAVQEQQEQIEVLKKVNAELVKTNAEILKRLEKLEEKK